MYPAGESYTLRDAPSGPLGSHWVAPVSLPSIVLLATSEKAGYNHHNNLRHTLTGWSHEHKIKGRSLQREERAERAGLGISGSVLTVIRATVGFEPHRECTHKEIMVYEAAAL